MVNTERKSYMDPFGLSIELESGTMKDPLRTLVRKASDMKGYYRDKKALKELIDRLGDPVHYEVSEVPVPEEYGHLMYCISTLQPGLIGEEYFMTKGHYHSIAGTAEIYLCLKGRGYMLMKTENGIWKAEEMARGRMVYVPPFWAHRSVNTGEEALVSFCVYPGDAGHNYGDIEKEGFPVRICRKDDKIIIK